MPRGQGSPARDAWAVWGAMGAAALVCTLAGALLPVRPPLKASTLQTLRAVLLGAGVFEIIVWVQVVRPLLAQGLLRQTLTWAVCASWVCLGLVLRSLGGNVIDLALAGGGAVGLLVYFAPLWSEPG